jgi:hypothetical protein
MSGSRAGRRLQEFPLWRPRIANDKCKVVRCCAATGLAAL